LIRKIKGKTKTKAKLQEHENLLKQHTCTLIEPGLPLADCASEIESMSTPDAEQVQETTDLQSKGNLTSKKGITTALLKQRLLIIYIGL